MSQQPFETLDLENGTLDLQSLLMNLKTPADELSARRNHEQSWLDHTTGSARRSGSRENRATALEGEAGPLIVDLSPPKV